MNERILELMTKAGFDVEKLRMYPGGWPREDLLVLQDFAELIVRECAKELREAEQEANRAYKAKEVKERNTFDGYDFADMLEERFGVEE